MSDKNFELALKNHLDAIKNKNFEAFIQSVKLDEVTLIMPNGNFISDKDSFINLHRDWFFDEDWNLEHTLIKTEVGLVHAFALLAIDYTDCDAEGNTIKMKYYLNLIFRKCDDAWLLIHDQNTIFK